MKQFSSKTLTIVLFIVSFLTLLLLYCIYYCITLQQKGEVIGRNIYEVLDDLGGFKEIIHIEEVDNGLVVFYIPQIKMSDNDQKSTTLSVIFIKRTLFGLVGTIDRGFFTINETNDLQSMYIPQINENSGSPFPILFGQVNNPKITKVRAITSNNDLYETDIVKNGDHSIWFLFTNGKKYDHFQIKGLTEENEMITSIPSNRNNI